MIKVKDVMKKDFPTLKEHESISDAIKLLVKLPESSLPVIDANGKVLGEISQEQLLLKIIGVSEMTGSDLDFMDIRRLLSSKSKDIDDLIERHTLTAKPNDDIKDIIKLMFDNELTTIPVIDKGNLVGILTDILVLKHYKELI